MSPGGAGYLLIARVEEPAAHLLDRGPLILRGLQEQAPVVPKVLDGPEAGALEELEPLNATAEHPSDAST